MAKKVTRIRDCSIIENSRKSVFVTFYSNHIKKINKSVSKSFPLVLLILRGDGRIGFPGGKYEIKDSVDQNNITIEDLKNTAIREVYEELNYDIKFRENLKLETNYLVNNNQIFNFSYYVTEQELINIQNNYINKNTQSHIELSGVNICYLYSKSVLNSLLNNNFKTTAKDELKIILKRHFDII